MATRRIVKEGDEILTKVCKPVEKFDDRLRNLVADMKETLIKADGLGLAAPQVGILRRIFVMFDKDGVTMLTFINPEIVSAEGKQEGKEGCLSIPGVFAYTERPAKVTVSAYDEWGNKFEVTRDEVFAVCLCHENDHLNGILFRKHVKRYIEDE